MTPISFWPQLAGGGWSMFGLVGGVFLGGWAASRIMKEKTAKVLDILSVSLLPTIVAERIAENRIEDFDISRALDSPLLANSFLAVGEDEPCLATYYVAAAAALVLCNAENIVDYKSVLLLIGAFLAVWKYKAGPIWVLIISGALGLVLYP